MQVEAAPKSAMRGVIHYLLKQWPYLIRLMEKRRTYEMLEACADVVVMQEKYHPSVYSHRNRYMAEHSDRVIAVYDGREKGGTVRTIRFAHQMKKEFREIPVGEIFLS